MRTTWAARAWRGTCIGLGLALSLAGAAVAQDAATLRARHASLHAETSVMSTALNA